VTSAQIVEHVRGNGASATLVNVWATWCGPCREEFPDLVRFQREFRDRGVEVMYVSADFDDQVAEIRKFLSDQGVAEPGYLKDEADMAFIDGLDPRWSGALPATFVYDRTGKLVRYWEGRADYDRFVAAAEAAMQTPAAQ
jgi:thiol-disulfide isomerase/thioredoxin